MPHITIEVTNNVLTEIDADKLVTDAHAALAGQGIDMSRIKTHMVVSDYYTVGENGWDGKMIHVTLALLTGRDVPLRKQYGQAIYDSVTANAQAIEDCAITLEVREMLKDTYFM